jgi:hypothetical protein
MIYNYETDKTVETTSCDGTPITTTFNRLIPTGGGDEYESFYVVDNSGTEQATSNGTIVLTAEQFSSL